MKNSKHFEHIDIARKLMDSLSFPRKRESTTKIDPRFRGGDICVLWLAMTLLSVMLLTPLSGFSEDVPLFQIVQAADSAENLESYVDGSITAVTGTLGAPSATWFNPDDDTLIDYIFVGQSTVLTIHVLKEGKNIQEVVSDSRSTWESGACLAYPECPVKVA